MTDEERIDKLKVARRLVGEARSDCGLPQIESILNDADMALHWALWNLGEVETLHPVLEG